MSVSRSTLPMRGSTSVSASRTVTGDHIYVTVLVEQNVAHDLNAIRDPDGVLGVLTLHRSLKRVRAAHPLLCLCIGVTDATQLRLVEDDIQVRKVEPLEKGRAGVFSKVQVLKLLEYRLVLFLDYDTIVIKNIDHLFGLRTCDFAFAPDIGVDVSASR